MLSQEYSLDMLEYDTLHSNAIAMVCQVIYWLNQQQ